MFPKYKKKKKNQSIVTFPLFLENTEHFVFP